MNKCGDLHFTRLLYTAIIQRHYKAGPLEKRLTHMPFTHALTGSNPVRVTKFYT